MCIQLLTCLKAAYTRLGDAFKASHCVQLSQEHFPEAHCRYLATGLEAKVRFRFGRLVVQMDGAFMDAVQMDGAFMDAVQMDGAFVDSRACSGSERVLTLK
jgi:hypothetical protein